MSAMASQITSLTIVYSSVCSGADQRKHQSSASLAFVTGDFPSQRASNAEKKFPFDDVIHWCQTNISHEVNIATAYYLNVVQLNRQTTVLDAMPSKLEYPTQWIGIQEYSLFWRMNYLPIHDTYTWTPNRKYNSTVLESIQFRANANHSSNLIIAKQRKNLPNRKIDWIYWRGVHYASTFIIKVWWTKWCNLRHV